MIEISSDIAAWVSIGIVLAMFALFITEIFPTEVVAISGVARCTHLVTWVFLTLLDPALFTWQVQQQVLPVSS